MNHPPIYFMVRNDDICALSDAAHEHAVCDVFAKHGVPMTVAVIPKLCEDPHSAKPCEHFPLEDNPGIVELLREGVSRELLEVAVHGYTHQTNRFRPGQADVETTEKNYPGIDRAWSPNAPLRREGFSEFAGLPREEQADKVRQGVQHIERVLGVRPVSYIFPWNAYDKQVLPILEEHGIRFVPGEEEESSTPGLDIIGGCVWDWEVHQGYDWLDPIFNAKAPVLAHFGIHSWVYKQQPEMLRWLDELLEELTSLAGVKFILPRDLPKLVPGYQAALNGRRRLNELTTEVNQRLRKRLRTGRHYILDATHYESRTQRLRTVVTALRVGGETGKQLGRSLLPRALKDQLLTVSSSER